MSLRRRIDPWSAVARRCCRRRHRCPSPCRAGRTPMVGGFAPIRAASRRQRCRACRPRAQAGAGEIEPRGAAWYRLDPILDAAGGLDGQRLVAGRVGQRGELRIGARCRVVRVRTIRRTDPRRQRRRPSLHRPDRRHRTALRGRRPRGSRADQACGLRCDGRRDRRVPPRPLDPGGPRRLEQAGGRLEADATAGAARHRIERIGRVFATELSWSVDGRRLVVTSCGEASCLARILDRATGRRDDRRRSPGRGGHRPRRRRPRGLRRLPGSAVRDRRDGPADRPRPGHRCSSRASPRVSVADGVGVVAFEDYDRRAPSRRPPRRDCRPDAAARRTACGSFRAPIGRWRRIELPAGIIALAEGGRPSRALAPATFINLADGRRLSATEVVP